MKTPINITRLILLVCVMLLASCANFKPYEGKDGGYMVASFYVETNRDISEVNEIEDDEILDAKKVGRFNFIDVLFRSLDREGDFAIHKVPLVEFSTVHLEDSTDYKTIIFDGKVLFGNVDVKYLKPGQYEIYDIYASANGYRTTFKLTEEISIPFEVKTGEVIYLGSFEPDSIFGENVFGLEVLGGIVFDIHNRQQLDIEEAEKINAGIQGKKVNSIFERDLAPISIFRFKENKI